MDFDKYIKRKQWRYDYTRKRKIEIFKSVEQAKKSKSIIEKIGIITFYNQLIEEVIKETIILSYAYMKIKLSPKEINVDISFDNLTFGGLINKFEHSCIVEYNYKILVVNLKELNKLRNKLAHNLLKIKNNREIKQYLNNYSEIADETFMLILEYYGELSENIESLISKQKSVKL